MKASEIATLPITAGAALRRRRFFHPTGVLATGSIERLAPPREGLPIESGQIIGRMSKALGTPGGLPDATGLAWRMAPAPFAATPWDVLLVSAGLGSVSDPEAPITNRMLLRPVTSWSAAMYSSLLPLRCHDNGRDGLWWLRARLETPVDGLSLQRLGEQIDSAGMEFAVEHARGSADFTPLARLCLTETVTADEHRDVSFDPVLNSAPGVEVWPEWLKDVRRTAYRSSRVGRHAE